MRKILILVSLAAVAVVALVLALRWDGALTRRDDPETVDAYVAGDRTPLSAQVAGYVRRVAVADNVPAHQGDTVVEIADEDYRAALAQAEAQSLAARAAAAALGEKRAVLEQQLVQAREAIVSANAQLGHAFNEVRRQEILLPTAGGLLQSLQTAQAEERRLAGTRDQAVADAEIDARQITLLTAQSAQAAAQVKAADAKVALARISLDETRITAPIAGMLGERLVREGSLLGPGTPVDTVTPLDTLWVSANFTERQITHVRPGQPARVRIDAFPGVALSGTVAGVQPATGSAFSPLPSDNTTGNFTKVVQRVPVKIALDLADSSLAGRLRPGMSARATVLTSGADGGPP